MIKTIKELEAEKGIFSHEELVVINTYKQALKDMLGLIDKEIKKCKVYIKQQKGFLKLKEMTNKEWLKGRIEECEYTIDMLEELKVSIGG